MPIATLETSVVDLVDQWTAKTPSANAAEWQGEVLTYAELRDASLYVSNVLLSAGVVPGTKVPLLTEMSLEMLPAIIGILRTGASYVPIDVAAWSKERIYAALEAVSSPVVLATSSVDDLQPPSTICFQSEWLHLAFDADVNLFRQLDTIRDELRPEDLAYVIFTSGTTGRPKGVMVPHRAIHNLVSLKEGDVIKTTPGKRILLTFSIAFDGCAGIVWTTLTNGGTLVMASSSDYPERSTTCHTLILTPSMLAPLDPSSGFDKVQEIYLGGEAPSLSVVRPWITPTRNVYNAYGPSEATVAVTVTKMNPDEEPILGKVIPGVRIVLVDENMQEAELGEIMIAGPCLATGYINNPELTASKFIDCNGERFYRTGDRARRTEKGLVWAGRVDRLVKNRGFLVNLESEVEPALLRFGPVRTATAFIWRTKMIGCVQPEDVVIDDLRAFMKQNFDHFVVPDEFLAMETFPLTANGKVDWAALRAQLDERIGDDEAIYAEGDEISAYDALRLAFSSILFIPFKELDQDSSFTRLGGNSLTAIKLSQFLLKRGYYIPIPQILKADTISSIELGMKRNTVPSPAHDDQVSDSDPVPMTDMQKLLISQSQQHISRNCIVLRIKYTGSRAPSPSELHAAFIKVLPRHSIYQTKFDLTTWTQSSLDKLNLEWREIEVAESEFESAIASNEAQIWTQLQAGTPLSLDVPYSRMTCISAPASAAGRSTIAVNWQLHHVLTDGFTIGMLQQDLDKALAGSALPPAPRFRDFALFFQQYKRENLDRVAAHYKHMLEPLRHAIPLCIRAPATPPAAPGYLHVKQFATSLDAAAVEAAARALAVSSTTLVCGAWALTLRKLARSPVVCCLLSLSGRMLPWPDAPFLAGAMHARVPWCVRVPTSNSTSNSTSTDADADVGSWLAAVHSQILDLAEVQNLCSPLPSSVLAPADMARCFNSIVQSFLGMQPPAASWDVRDMQPPPVPLLWQVYEHRQKVYSVLEIDQTLVDLDWAEEVGRVAARVLQGLVGAGPGVRVGDLE
ncbi:putative nonribosomal peptide synthase [Hypoxylon sp. NC1633]|nr:putative nonribosomal peptide synthase [Hypoxylon sp. NC1633]